MSERCPIRNKYCLVHDFQHGYEAEELRKGIENIINSIDGNEQIAGDDVIGRFQRLLDRVDARDSLAFCESRPKRRSPTAKKPSAK
jgi:hypothetical protein